MVTSFPRVLRHSETLVKSGLRQVILTLWEEEAIYARL